MCLMFTLLVTGDQVSKKGGMTGGFYDYRRSKLKFMNTVRQNTRSINSKQEELDSVRFKLQDILFYAIHSMFFYFLDVLFE